MDRMPRVRGSPWVSLLLACCSIVFVANTYFSSQSAESLTEFRENEFPLRAGPVFHTALYPEISSSPRHMRRVYRPLLSMLQEWEPDNPNPPGGFTEFLQHFNYSDPSQRLLAEKYRRAELPFKVYDVPIFNNVSRMWTDEYLSHNLRKMRFGKGYHVEESPTNHFMYWTMAKKVVGEKYKPPTKIVSDEINFDTWSNLAKDADKNLLPPSRPHQYFMAGSQRSDDVRNFIHRDLSVFRSDSPNLFIPTPDRNKGMQCRFGIRGIIAETHYDGGRNSVAMIRGSKRYILSPPEACRYLDVISDKKHPSFRHSTIDFVNLERVHANEIRNVRSIQTIVRAGEVLYIPSFWFHYIVSLNYSIQCNARSGFPDMQNGKSDIEKCMNLKIRSNGM